MGIKNGVPPDKVMYWHDSYTYGKNKLINIWGSVLGKLKSLLVKLYSIGVIKKSNFFDKEWYINEYSDLGGIYRVFPTLHYAFFGYKEGRNPSKSFVTDYYLNAYEDVKKSGLNPLYHY